MKIIVIGKNYNARIDELSDKDKKVPNQPVVFMKSDNTLLKDNKPFFIPDFSSQIDHEAQLVVRINRLGKNISTRFAHRYYDEVTLGVDLVARDLEKNLREQESPCEISRNFDGSAVIGDFISLKELGKEVQNVDFRLDVDKQTVQEDSTQKMLFKVDEIIAYISKFVTLKIGDLIFTGTCAGVNKLSIDQHIEGFVENKKLLDFQIK